MARRTYQGRTIDGRDVSVTVDGERIVDVAPAKLVDPPLIAPPLVDLQHNGALGFRYNHLHKEPEGLRKVASHLKRHGVGRVLLTTTTYPFDLLLETLREFDRQLRADAELARLFVGHFHEGIYISGEPGWGGAHELSHIRKPSWNEWQRIVEASGGRTRIFNVDPSLDGAIETIGKATKAGLLVSMGHCNPSSDHVKAACDAGASLVTHFGNGMPAQVHRHHNPLWSYLADSRLRLGLIADGHHLPADVMRAAFAAKGHEGAYIVSDASPFSGLPPGDYERVTVTADGVCRLRGQELLAGAWFQLDRGVERLCQMGWKTEEAWRQASEIPARIMGIAVPRIEVGEAAEFVVARYRDGALTLEQAVDRGVELLAAPVTPLAV